VRGYHRVSSANLPSTRPKNRDPSGKSASSNSNGNPNDLLGNSENNLKGKDGLVKNDTHFEGKRKSAGDGTPNGQHNAKRPTQTGQGAMRCAVEFANS